MVKRIEKGLLRCFGNIERISESSLMKGIYRGAVKGSLKSRHPRKV